MNKLLYILLFLPFLTHAQYDIFLTGQDSVVLGQDVVIAVNLANAPGVGSITAKVEWDTAYLEYVGIDEINTSVDFMTSNEIGTTAAEMGSGRVNFFWDNEVASSTDFIDTTWFFSVKLKGKQVGFTNLELTNVEVTNEMGLPYDHNFTNANMTIYETVGVNDLDADAGVSLGQFSPNPTEGSTQIVLDLDQSMQLRYDVYNSLGQKMMTQSQFMNGGNHTIYFDNQEISNAGIYFVVFTDGTKTATRKLIIK